LKRLGLFLLLFIILGAVAWGEIYTWTGDVDGETWAEAGNWIDSGGNEAAEYPGETDLSDNAVIDNGTTVKISGVIPYALDTLTITDGSLEIESGGSLTAATLTIEEDGSIDNSGTVTVTDSVTIDGGSLTIADDGSLEVDTLTINDGLLEIEEDGTLEATTLTIEEDGSLNNSGTVTVTDSVTIDGGSLTIADDGTLEVDTLTINDGSLEIEEDGSLEATDVTINGGSLNNSGTLTVTTLTIKADGTLDNTSGSLEATNVTIEDNATLDGNITLAGGTLSINGANDEAAIAGTGTIGSIDVDTRTVSITTAGSNPIIIGTITGGTKNLVVGGTGNLNSGGINNTFDRVTINADTTLAAALNTGILNVNATLTLGGQTLGVSNSLTIDSGGSLTLDANLSIPAAAVSVLPGGTLTLGANTLTALSIANTGTLSLNGTAGQLSPVPSSIGGTVEFTGSGTSLSGLTGFNNLIIQDGDRSVTSDAISVLGDFELNGGLLDADSLTVEKTSKISANITTDGNQEYTGTVTLGAAVTLEGSTVTLGEVNGDYLLTIDGAAEFNGEVDIGSLEVSGNSSINADITTTTTQQYAAVTLGDDETVVLYTLTGTTVTISGTVTGNGNSLKIDGNAVLETIIDSPNNLTALTVTGGTATINEDITTSGTQQYGAVELGGTGTRTLTGTTVTIGGMVTGNSNSLEIDGNAFLNTVNNLAGLTVNNGAATLYADITTSGNQTYNGTVTLGGSGKRTLETDGGYISIDGIDNAPNGVTIEASGDITVGNGGITASNGTAGVIRLNATNANININGDIEGYQLLAIAEGHTVTIGSQASIQTTSNGDEGETASIYVEADTFIVNNSTAGSIKPGTSGQLCLKLVNAWSNVNANTIVSGGSSRWHQHVTISYTGNVIFSTGSVQSPYYDGNEDEITSFQYINSENVINNTTISVSNTFSIYIIDVGNNAPAVSFVIGSGNTGVIEIHGVYKSSTLTLEPGIGGITLVDAEIELTGNFDTNGADLTLTGSESSIKAANVTLGGAVNGAGDFTVTGAAISMDGDVSTGGDQTYNGLVTLGDGDKTLESTSGKIVIGTGLSSTAGDVEIKAGSGGIFISGNVSTGGEQEYIGTVTLDDVPITLAGSTVTLGSIIGAGNSLAITGNAVFNGGTGIGALTVSGTAGFSAAMSAASVNVTGASTIGANITTTGGTQRYTGNVTLDDVPITLAGSTVTLGSITGAGNSLAITGNAVFNGGTGIGALTVSGTADFSTAQMSAASVEVTGTSTIGADITTTGGTQLYAAAVTLGDDENPVLYTLTGDITIGGAVTGNDNSLKIDGDAEFNGGSGIGALTVTGTADFSTAQMSAVSVNVTGASSIKANITTTTTQQYAAVTLGGSGPLYTLEGATVTIGGAVVGNNNSLTITGNAVLNAVSGLAELTVTGTSTINANITTTGDQTYSGDVTLGANVTLDGNTVTLGNISGAYSLTVDGNAELNTVSGLTGLTVTEDAALNDDITTSGDQTYSGTVELVGSGAQSLISTGGGVTSTGNVSATNGITINAGVDINIGAGGINSSAITGVIILEAGGDIEIDGSIYGYQLLIQTAGDVTVSAGIETSSNGQHFENASIYIRADNLSIDSGLGNNSIIPGASGQLCLMLDTPCIDTYADGFVQGNRWHQHINKSIDHDKHLVYYYDNFPPAYGTADYVHIESTDTDYHNAMISVDPGYNIYIFNVSDAPTVSFIIGSGNSGVIEIHGDYKTTSPSSTLILEPGTGGIKLVDAEIELTGNFDTNLPVGVALTLEPGSTNSITAANITLGEVGGTGNLTLNATTAISIAQAGTGTSSRISDLTITGSAAVALLGDVYANNVTTGAGLASTIGDVEIDATDSISIKNGGIEGTGSLTLTSPSTAIDGDITTSGNQTYNGDVTIGGSGTRKLESTGGYITTTGLVDAPSNSVTIKASGKITVGSGGITASNGATGVITLESTGADIDINGDIDGYRLLAIAIGNTVKVDAGIVTSSDGEEGTAASIYVNAETFDVNNSLADSIVPGTTTGQLCLWLNEPWSDTNSVVQGDRWHQHLEIKKHLVYSVGTGPVSGFSPASDYTFVDSTDTHIREDVFSVPEDYDIYIISVGTISKSLTFNVTGDGIIEIRGAYTSSSTLTLNAETGGVHLVDAVIALTGNNFNTGSAALTLAGTTGNSITAASITLGEVGGTGNLTLNATTAISIAQAGTALARIGTLNISGSAPVALSGSVYAASVTTDTGLVSVTGDVIIDANGITIGTDGIGGTGSLTLTSSVGTTIINGDITTGGNQTYNGAVTIGGSGLRKLESTGGTITTGTGNVAAPNGVTIKASGIVTIGSGGITASTVVNNKIRLESTGAGITINGAVSGFQLIAIAQSGTVTFGASVTVTCTGDEEYDAAIHVRADHFNITVSAPNSIVPGDDPGQLCLILGHEWNDPNANTVVKESRWHQDHTPKIFKILYSFTEDISGDGILDRIRVQTNVVLNGDFDGFGVNVVGYEIDRSKVIAPDGFAMVDDDSFCIYLVQKSELNGESTPEWWVTSKGLLNNAGNAVWETGLVGKHFTPIDTIPPRIAYTLTLPNNPQTYVRISEPVANGSFNFGGTPIINPAPIDSSNGYLLDSASLAVTELVGLINISNPSVITGYFSVTNMKEKKDPPINIVIIDGVDPKYPVNWGYTAYSTNSIYAPPYGLILIDDSPLSGITVNSAAPVIRRVTDVLISRPLSANDDNYFAWPAWARNDKGTIDTFNGSAFLEEGNVELQAKIKILSIDKIIWTTADIPSDRRNPKVMPVREKSVGGLWLPGSNLPYNYVLPTPIGDCVETIGAPVGSQLYNFPLGNIESGKSVEFIFRINSSDMFAARLDAPAGSVPTNWYDLVRPFGFYTQNIRRQRGGVSVLNNVINSDAREEVIIRYDLARAGRVTIQVYTLEGTLVKSIRRNEHREAGVQTDTWNGSNNSGRPIARGIYFIRVVGPDIDEIRKVMVIR